MDHKASLVEERKTKYFCVAMINVGRGETDSVSKEVQASVWQHYRLLA